MQRQKLHPTDGFFVIGAFVVAFDRDDGNPCCAEPLQGAHRLVQRERVDGPLLEEIPGQNDKIDFALDVRIECRLFAQRLVHNRVESPAEVVESFFLIVLLIAEMDVGAVQEASCHLICLRNVKSVRSGRKPKYSSILTADKWSILSAILIGRQGKSFSAASPHWRSARSWLP